ncbi:MAG: TonB-dependent receptor [Ideonella sp.]|nr:TonB-dependent receptor [Ideonella sp.]
MMTGLLTKGRRGQIALAAAALVLAISAQAQVRTFDIPAGDLKSAIDAYIAQSGRQLIYRAADLTDRRSREIKGELDAERALANLLEGTQLKVRRDASGALVIFVGEAGSGDASATEPEKLQRVEITASALHLAERNRTGTRVDADPMELPMSVSTVSKELLAQQQALNLRDALVNVAGVQDLVGGGNFTMRGFLAGVMRNGDILSFAQRFDAPLITISRVEVVKGPEAIIAGVTSGYGGVVNLITKSPQREPVLESVATVGSRGYYELGVDAGSPVNEDKSLQVRLVASKQGARTTFSGYDGSNKEYVAPSLTWRNRSSGTEVTASYEYQKGRTAPSDILYTDQPQLGGGLKGVGLGGADTGEDSTQKVTSLSLNQRIFSGWELGLNFTRDERRSISRSADSSPSADLGFPFPNVVTFVSVFDEVVKANAAKVQLKGGFDTGPVSHSLLLAYDDHRLSTVSGVQFMSISATNLMTGVFTDLNPILGPDFGGVPGLREEDGTKPAEKGLLVMDHLTWGQWVALAGVRAMRYDPGNAAQSDLTTFKETLPSLGVLYRVTPSLSVYASASKGFTPNFRLRQFDGNPVAPEHATQAELGVKAVQVGGRMAFTAAVFDIKQQNVAVRDSAHPGSVCTGRNYCYVSVPGVRSQGAELEFSGEVMPGLTVRANYAYTDKQASTQGGTGLPYVRNTASLWGNYRFGGVMGAAWWLGAGLQYRGKVVSRAASSNPEWTRLDINGGYEAKSWSLVAGVKNAADKQLYPVLASPDFARLGQQREFYLTGRYNFR